MLITDIQVKDILVFGNGTMFEVVKNVDTSFFKISRASISHIFNDAFEQKEGNSCDYDIAKIIRENQVIWEREFITCLNDIKKYDTLVLADGSLRTIECTTNKCQSLYTLPYLKRVYNENFECSETENYNINKIIRNDQVIWERPFKE